MRPKILRKGVSRIELDRMLQEAESNSRFEPMAVKAWYDRRSDTVFALLSTGGTIGFPRAAHPVLAKAPPSVASKIDVGGYSLWWPKIDDGCDVSWMIERAVGREQLQRIAARLRGEARTAKKRAAARRNGRKGGRPRAA